MRRQTIQSARTMHALWAAMLAHALHGALADGTTLDLLAEVAAVAASSWLLVECIRDWRDKRRGYESAWHAAFVGARALSAFNDPTVSEVWLDLRRDGGTYRASVVSVTRNEGAPA